MTEYELTFASANSVHYPKRITAFITEPDVIDSETGMMHGTADNILPHAHTQLLEAALRKAGKEFRVKYYEGGGHALEPVCDRKTATIELADDWLRTRRTSGVIDFEQKAKTVIPCVNKKLVVDWSKSLEDHSLVHWEEI